jgi:hypothetical protein
MAKKDEGNGIVDLFEGIGLLILCSIIFFSPGIALASIIDYIIPLTTILIWLIVILFTVILIAIPYYFTNNNRLLLLHFTISGSIFIILVIYTLIDDSNMFYLTLKRMYPAFML